MWYNIITSELLFKLSLFSLLLYKIVSLTRNYVHPFLKKYLISEKKYVTEVVEKEHLLTATRQKLESQIFNQKQFFTLLEKNVQSWHNMLRAELADQQARLSEQRKKVLLKQRLILEHKNFEVAAADVIPTALYQAQTQLSEIYSTHDGQALLGKLIEALPAETLPQSKAKS
jgi:hypothetical protein